MTERQERERERCLKSIFWTAWYLCGYRKLSIVLHLAMALWLEKKLREGCQWILVMITRDYFKTSCLGIAGVVNRLINRPDDNVLYMMHKYQKASEKMDEVQKAFESRKMLELFPELAVTKANMSSLKWTSGAFTIPRPSGARGAPSVTCAGIVSGVTGDHYDYIVLDDIIRGDTDEAAAQLAAGIRFMRVVIFLFKDKKASQLLVLGTLWEGGFYEALMESKHFVKLILGARVDDRFERLLDEVGVAPPRDPEHEYVKASVLESNHGCLWQEGHAIFPEMEDDESIATAEEIAGVDATTQMYNIPSGSENKRFLRENIVTYDLRFKANGRPLYAEVDEVAFPCSGMHRRLTWDPTGGESKDCDTAAVSVCGWEPANRKGFLYDYWWERADIITQINRVLDMAVRWDVHFISPESVAFQVTLKPFLEEEMKRRVTAGTMKRMIRVDPYKRGAKSKGTWILDSLAPFVSNHQFHVLPEHGKVIDHLVGLNIRNGIVVGASPGLADVLAMQAHYWKGKLRKPKRADDGILDEEDMNVRANMPVAYGLERSVKIGMRLAL